MRVQCIIILSLLVILTGCDRSASSIQGYVDADYVYVSSPSPGILNLVEVKKGQLVKKHTRLFSLDAEQEIQQLHQSQAQVESEQHALRDLQSGKRSEEISILESQLKGAKVSLSLAQSKYRRERIQYEKKHLAEFDFDRIKREMQQKQAAVEEIERRITAESLPAREGQYAAQSARVAQAQARQLQAAWLLKQTAPDALTAGRVFDIFYQQGEWVPAGSPVLALLPAENIKIRFFVSSAQLKLIRYDQFVKVTLLNGRTLLVKISYISPEAEYTPPFIYSNGRKEKMVFLVEAKPELPAQSDGSLHPGMPVEVTL